MSLLSLLSLSPQKSRKLIHSNLFVCGSTVNVSPLREINGP